MAVYDRQQGRIVVRIVYDGAACSGKTTNLRRIFSSFTVRRRGELITPEESDGRTQFFDWLELEGGFVGGISLRFQLVTVPGQRSLRRRRERLLAQADAVAFICDSTEVGIDDARDCYQHLSEVLTRRADPALGPAPIVLQANKQDLPKALAPEEVAVRLGMPAGPPAVSAVAEQDHGVRETLVLVAREAASRVQRLLVEYGVDALIGVSESPQVIYAAMRAAQILAGDGISGRSAPRRAEPAAPPAEPLVEPPAGTPAPEPQPVDEPPEPEPGMPHPMVPSGYIWPGHSGRNLLRELADGVPVRRTDLIGQHGASDGSGTSDAILFEIGDWFLKTSPRRRYDDVDQAREALLRLARKKVTLGDLLMPQTVLTLRPEESGELWLWTVAPRVETLRSRMVEAERQGDQVALGEALSLFARAAVASMLAARRRQILLDVHPGNFATVAGRVVYLDDDIDEGGEMPLIGHLLLGRVGEYEHRPAAIDAYLSALETELRTGLGWEDALELDLPEAIRHVPVRSPAMRDAQARLVRVIDSVVARP